MVSLAAPHAKGKKSNDVIFGASAAAKADIQKIGAEWYDSTRKTE